MAPWAKRQTRPQQAVSSPKVTYEFNDYSEGFNSYLSNDKFPLVNGSTNMLRLAQDARISTLGQYESRKGFDYHSDAAGLTQDQAITSVTGAADQSFNTVTRLAQPFTAGASGSLTKVTLNLKNASAATGTVVAAIYSNNSGVPLTQLDVSSVAASALTGSYAYLTFRFPAAPALVSGTTYWIVVYVQAIGSGSYNWSSTTSATTAKVSIDSGVTWSSTSYALNFTQSYATTGGTKGLFRGYKSDGTKVTLMAHGTSLYSVSEATGALTAIKTGLSASATNYRFEIVNDTIYYVNGYDGYRKWDFTTESQVSPANYTLICAHKGLMFLQDGTDPNKLVYSNFGLYEIFTSTNFLYVPSPKTGDSTTALESLNGFLLVFTRNNKFILSGSDNATFSLDEAPDQHGTYTQETVTKDDNYVYYLASDGVYRSNGSEPQPLSGNIHKDILTLANKTSCCIAISKGRLYLWYQSATSGRNDSCYVWDLNSPAGINTIESTDTNAYVSHAFNAFKDDDSLLVASSIIGQAYWQELSTNDYNNLGGPINFIVQSHYMHFAVRLHYQYLGGPSVLKYISYWEPRFGAQSGNYTMDCDYAYDLRDNWQTYSTVNLQGVGAVWGSGILWGSFTWGTNAELQSQLYIPGEYRRVAVRYKHLAMRQPVSFLGHTLVVNYRKIR